MILNSLMKKLNSSPRLKTSIKNYTTRLKNLDMARPQVYYGIKIEITLPVRSLSKSVAADSQFANRAKKK
ncbi:hypothetical protein JCM39068_30000 [Desulfocastanea catecholica]